MKMKNKFIYIIIASIVMTFSACLDEIDLPLPRGFEPIIVIQGAVVKSKNALSAKVFISNSSSSTSFSQLIRVASVTLENDKGQKIALSDGQDGSYITSIPLNSSAFDSKNTNTYRLTVVDFKKNTYQSTFEPILDGSTLSNPKFEVTQRTITTPFGPKDTVKFFTSKVDINKPTSAGNLYKFDYEHSYAITEGQIGGPRLRTCYVTNLLELNGINIQDLKTITPEKLKSYPAIDISLDYKFAEESYVSIIIGSITEQAKDYFEQQNLLRSKDITIFQPQGERITTNFTTLNNEEIPVIGYFYGSFQDTVRMKVLPSAVGSPRHVCPTTLNEQRQCNFPQCCNCMQLKGASLSKPAFWN
jgi:hypothetical protein